MNKDLIDQLKVCQGHFEDALKEMERYTVILCANVPLFGREYEATCDDLRSTIIVNAAIIECLEMPK